MRHCVLPGKSHLWACWSKELLKLALAGYWATGLAGCTPASTSDVNHSFASLPCAIQKYFVTLLVGRFLNVILNLQKRETWKCRLSVPVRLDTHIQLWDTIHYCSDMSPAVINRWRLACGTLQMKGKCTGDECQLLFLSKALLKDQYYFLFHWLNLKNNCGRAAELNCSHYSGPNVFSLFTSFSTVDRPWAYLLMVAWLLISLHLKLCMVCF